MNDILNLLRMRYPGSKLTDEFDVLRGKRIITVWSDDSKPKTFEYDIWLDNIDDVIADIDDYLHVGGSDLSCVVE